MDLAPFPVGLSFCGPNEEPSIDTLTYAVGDVHGRFDLFESLIGKLEADVKARGRRCRLVLLGDYIDKGPDSSSVLSGVASLQKQSWCEVVALKGNHEWMLIEFLAGRSDGRRWIRSGGDATLRSFGIAVPDDPVTPEGWDTLRWRLRSAFNPPQWNLLTSLKTSFEAGDYLFVHAGVDPWKDRSTQGEETLLWIRDRFLKVKRACSKVVVHGHSSEDSPVMQKWRIGLDTAAYATGKLCAIRLVGSERTLFEANHRSIAGMQANA